MNFSPTRRQKPQHQCSTTIYCQRNSIFHRQKKKSYIIHLFDRPKSGFVRAKKYLAGHHDWRPVVRYFEPCIMLLEERKSGLDEKTIINDIVKLIFVFKNDLPDQEVAIFVLSSISTPWKVIFIIQPPSPL